jgi:hypothetical protein
MMFARLKNWAQTLRCEVRAIYLAARDPRVPWYAKLLAMAVAGYALSPIDLIPDFVPVLGYVDDHIYCAARRLGDDSLDPDRRIGRVPRRCARDEMPRQKRGRYRNSRGLDSDWRGAGVGRYPLVGLNPKQATAKFKLAHYRVKGPVPEFERSSMEALIIPFCGKCADCGRSHDSRLRRAACRSAPHAA